MLNSTDPRHGGDAQAALTPSVAQELRARLLEARFCAAFSTEWLSHERANLKGNLLWIGFVLAALCAAPSARGQIVNVQPLIVDPERLGLSGVVSASLDLRTGNTELVLISGSALARYAAERHLIFALLRSESGTQAGERFLNRDFEHLRYRFSALEGLQLEAFAQHDRDQFRRLALRLVLGAGPRFPFPLGECGELALGAAYLWELERLSAGLEPDAGERSVAHRFSGYATLGVEIKDGLRLAQSVYAQPRLDQPADFRVLSETELLISLSELLQLKLTSSMGYDSLPPFGRRALDTATKTGIEFHF